MTLESALLTAVATLAAVIAYFEKRQRAAEVRQRASDERNAELAERVGRVEGKQQSIEDLSSKALDMIAEAKKCHYISHEEPPIS